jgi:uncharacterized protein (TIGR03083 family)
MMLAMDGDAYLQAVRAAGERIAQAADGHLKIMVPSCPDYDVGSLLMHTGAFCRWVAETIRQGRQPDIDWSDVPTDAITFHTQEHARLLETLGARSLEEDTWSWGTDQRVRFWYRRAAQELSVHRWDVENAAGEPAPIDAAVAVDGVDELLEEFASREGDDEHPGVAEMFGGSGETLHLHATDTEGEWLLTMHPDRVEFSREHAKGDAAARGTASDLLLFVWGRIPPERLACFGDTALFERWHEHVKI